jgi:hypothetical protein
MSIFISIAAYRDPELMPTIRDCILRARYPAELWFGVCWQHGDDETAPCIEDHRLRLIDVPWHDSRGACWARAEIMKLWDGEDFFLQIDSHHRFVPGWDALLLALAERSGAAKPILSTYAAPFDPRAPQPDAGEPMQMDFDCFSDDGIPLFRPRAIADWADLRRSLRARFVSAHFLFTVGAFVSEVPYDPELYFHGEEITLAIRAFTHGYTLFHPPEHVLWHEYTREYRQKHWDDHVRARGIEVEWHARDVVSREKVRRFLAAPHVGPFGCGTARTFAAYETYAGLSLSARTAQDATLQGLEPAPPPAPSQDWHVRIVLDRGALQPEALADPLFWYVGVHDAEQSEIHREDAAGDELRRLLQDNGREIVIKRCFNSARQPATWTVWPVSRAGEWLGRTDRAVAGATLVRDGKEN